MRLVVALAMLSLWACGDDASPVDSGPDADADAADATADTAIPLPTVDPAALPMLTPCPEGWTEVSGTDGSPSTCAPYAGDGPEDCGAEEAHFVGTDGCALVGDPCPTAGFPPDLPGTDVVFVDAAAPPGGDGSRMAPFTEVSDALAVVPDAGTIAVAPGDYGPIRVEGAVTILGACTGVRFSSDDILPTVEIVRADVTLRNIRVTGSRQGMAVRESTVDMSGVVIDGIDNTALSVLQGDLTASRLKIASPGDTGIGVSNDSSIQLDHFVVLDAVNDSLRTSFASATMTDGLVVRDGDGQHYFAAEGEGTRFERMAFLGPGTLIATGTSLALTDCLVRGPPLGVNTLVGSIAAFEGGSLSMTRVHVDRYRTLAAAVADAGGALTMTDVVIEDTVGATSDASGHAVELGNGATGTLRRVWLARSTGVSILATVSGTALDLQDVTVTDTAPDPDGTFGRALQVQSGASVTGIRVVARGSHEASVVSATEGTMVQLSHLTVEDTLERTCESCGTAGVGVGAYLAARLTLDHFVIRQSALAGVQIVADGQVDLSEGVVESNPVGVNIQVPGYDVNRLTDGVYFRDNGTNLDSSDLPVPDPTVGR